MIMNQPVERHTLYATTVQRMMFGSSSQLTVKPNTWLIAPV